jgi:enoyl-CoA hydratase/carnithine racemase
MMSNQMLDVRHGDGGIAVVTLNRPERLNALTFGGFSELAGVCDGLANDNAVRVVILTGAGRAFCAGLDLTDAGELPRMSVEEFMIRQEGWADAITCFRRLAKPVIAAVNGAAAGAGFSLALAADIRLCSPSAKFNAAFIKIGLTSGDCGSSWALPRIVGLGLASEILLTGRFVDAAEAAQIGLVNRVVESDQLLSEALELASLIASNSPVGVRLTKQAIQINVDAPSIEAAVELENRNQALASRTADMSEALLAFQEKRKPNFTGN